jgi:hypothetical protein
MLVCIPWLPQLMTMSPDNGDHFAQPDFTMIEMEGREILISVVSVSDFCFNSVFGFQFGFHLNHKNQIETQKQN